MRIGMAAAGVYKVGGDDPDVLRGTDEGDLLEGHGGNDSLYGYGGNDFLDGGLGDDILHGGAGDDYLNGGEGNDLLYGGAGDDYILIPAGHSRLEDAGYDRAWGGDGDDEIVSVSGIRSFIDGGAGDDVISSGLGGEIFGGSGNDFIEITYLDGDVVSGGGGDDLIRISLMTGASVIDLGTGSDRLELGAISDVTTFKAVVVKGFTAGLGGDVLAATPPYTSMAARWAEGTLKWSQVGDDTHVMMANDGQWRTVAVLVGVIADTLIGRNFGIQLDDDGVIEAAVEPNREGTDGADTFDWRPGADRMSGGLGDDVYGVDHVDDVIAEMTGAGRDRVVSTVSYVLSAGVEDITLMGRANLNATGNALANTLIGNEGRNVLDGRAGGDIMIGLDGDDTYYVDHAADRVIEAKDQGYDQVFASVSVNLAGTYVERLTLTGDADISAVGNSLANALVGNSGDNVLDGKGGVDRMAGGAGNDTYHVDHAGDRIYESKNAGSDHVISSVSFSLKGQYVEHLTLTGGKHIDATGNSLNNVITGNAGSNAITGGAGQDRLTGGGGDDRFVFTSLTDSTVRKSDRITDLSTGDVIDLSAIDADTRTFGDQAFSLVDAFGGIAGQATLSFDGSVTYLNLDVDGDGQSDFLLRLQGDHRDHDGWVW